MLMNRIMGAFTFRNDVYKEVEDDASFTSTAWVLVAIVAFLNQLGSRPPESLGRFIIAVIIGTIFAVVGFALGAMVISWVGREVFKAEVTFDELVRTLGLAYIWQAIAVLGLLGAVAPVVNCITAPVRIIAGILALVAWLMAAKEALDLEWVQTFVTVVIGFIVVIVLTMVATAVIGLLGFGAAAVTSAFG